MGMDKIFSYVRKNYFIIAIGICAVVILMFLSENFGASDSSVSKTKTDTESKLETFLGELQGVGFCDVLVFTESEKSSVFSSSEIEKIIGIAVICDGGGDVSVKAMIIDVLTRLFGISGSRISINERG